MRCPASAETWPASAWASASARSFASGATAAVQTKAVEQHRDALPPRRQRRAEDGGKLAAAERRGDRQRIVEHGGMAGERAVDDRALAREAFIIDAGAAAGPARAAAAEQRRRDRRRRRGIADAHLAQADQIALRRDRVVAGGHRGEEFLLVQRGLFGEIGGRLVERERDDAQLSARRARAAD